jgi:hypothetical protein
MTKFGTGSVTNHLPYLEWVPPALDKAVLRFVVKCPTQFGQHVILIGRYGTTLTLRVTV